MPIDVIKPALPAQTHAPGRRIWIVEPVFPTKDDAISYAQARVRFRAGEIRVLDSSGNVERTIAFSEGARML